MAVQLRVRDKDPVARFLGWVSIGLGAAELAAPRVLCKLVGAAASEQRHATTVGLASLRCMAPIPVGGGRTVFASCVCAFPAFDFKA